MGPILGGGGVRGPIPIGCVPHLPGMGRLLPSCLPHRAPQSGSSQHRRLCRGRWSGHFGLNLCSGFSSYSARSHEALSLPPPTSLLTGGRPGPLVLSMLVLLPIMLILTPGPLHSLGLLPGVLFPAPVSPPWPPACSPPLPPISCLFSAQALSLGNSQPSSFSTGLSAWSAPGPVCALSLGEACEPAELVPSQHGPAGFPCQPPF